jgi:hypothetical protein
MSFAAITLFVACQRVFTVASVHFVIDSVRKLLDTPSCGSGYGRVAGFYEHGNEPSGSIKDGEYLN